MPDQYLTVNDFLAYDKQLMGKLGRIGDNVADVKEQVNHLNTTFTAYRAETDAFRVQVNHHLASLDTRMSTLDTRIGALEQAVTQGFTRLFAHLGI